MDVQEALTLVDQLHIDDKLKAQFRKQIEAKGLTQGIVNKICQAVDEASQSAAEEYAARVEQVADQCDEYLQAVDNYADHLVEEIKQNVKAEDKVQK